VGLAAERKVLFACYDLLMDEVSVFYICTTIVFSCIFRIFLRKQQKKKNEFFQKNVFEYFET